MVYEKKLFVTRMVLASEITLLGHMLDRLSEKNRHYRDFTLDQLTAALRETIACFPVYRTYVEPDRPIRDEDRLIILKALRKARHRNPAIDKPVFDFIRKMLLLELPPGLGRAGTRRARPLHPEISAVQWADHGERSGGHHVLQLQPAHCAE